MPLFISSFKKWWLRKPTAIELMIFQSREQSRIKEEIFIAACREQPPSMEKIQPLVTAYPDWLAVRHPDGDTPLNLAIYNKASVELVLFMIDSYPLAVYAADDNEWLPIHTACRYCTTFGKLAILDRLIQEYPASLGRQNKQGWTPLHLACYYSAASACGSSTEQEEVIATLLLHFPLGTQSRTNEGWLPLHHACRCNASLPILELLVQNYTESVTIPNGKGLLPLHFACAHQAPLEVVTYLLDIYPEGILVPNQNQRLPIHIAFASRAPQDVIELLIHLTLEAVHATANTTSRGGGEGGESDSSAVNLSVVDNISRSLGAIQAFRRILPRTKDESSYQSPPPTGDSSESMATKTATCEEVTASCSEECCICLDPLNSKDKDGFESAQKVACGHSFHSRCLLQLIGREWTHSNDTARCPLCRAAIVTNAGLTTT
jgi:ankyrin repeat protein